MDGSGQQDRNGGYTATPDCATLDDKMDGTLTSNQPKLSQGMVDPQESRPQTLDFPFRPWVRNSCRKAMVWGLGVVGVLAVISWFFRTPGSFHLGRAFGVLLLYSLLFWASLAKIWWTARHPAVQLGPNWLAYQSVLYFRPTQIPLEDCLFCGPREGTQSQRLVYREPSGKMRELFLNLGVVKGRARLLKQLGGRLEELGLSPRLGRKDTWTVHGWTDDIE